MRGLLYADDLVLCGASEEVLKVMFGCFVGVYKRRGLKVNADKSKVRVLGGRKENMCQSFKYLGCALDESRTDSAE